MKRVLVTGASGFVGRRACVALAAAGWDVVAAIRGESARARVVGATPLIVGDLAREPDWPRALDGVDAVVHAAARVHVMRESAADPAAAFRRVNVEATGALARAALAAGVRRFAFVSSVKAMGEGLDRPYRETDEPRPTDAYGQSKLDAERLLLDVARAGPLEVTVLRPPLVYGPGVGGNFVRLLALARAARRVPLPLGGIANRRSLVHVDNLAAAITSAVSAERAVTGVFLVSDGEDLSTSELLGRLAAADGHRARLLPAPARLLRAAAHAVGRGAEADRLLGSLQLDPALFRRTFQWEPPVAVSDGLRQTMGWYDTARRTGPRT